MRFLVPLIITQTALSRMELRKVLYVIATLLVMYGAIGIFQFKSYQSMASILPNLSRNGAVTVVFDIV